MKTNEVPRKTMSGWMVVTVLFLALVGQLLYYAYLIRNQPSPIAGWVIGGVLASLLWIFLACGFFTLQPNMSAVLVLFGKYSGTEKTSGFRWANPLMLKKKVSLRAHNLNGEKLKVNDLRGNPIEIAVVVVWRVTNTAQAVFDVEDFNDFVSVQSEAALRHLAMAYSYDTFEGDTLSLRGSVDEVSAALKTEVQNRIERAGVLIEEARISHLAYAPEIAGAMLQRQQAEAVVAARSRIVDGAVGMVEMALDKLDQHKTIELDEERRAAMVTNLLVVLCGHNDVRPVVNTGSLYS
ncbi:MAG: SPFH domain-containing protein [Planctomycetota bacterium]|jgi:regulator of protease activity HflC (stomatin/prohibitin superfamily)